LKFEEEEPALDIPQAASGDRQPVATEVRDTLLEPFIAATRTALAEMAGTEVVVRVVYRRSTAEETGDIAAAVRLTSASEGLFLFTFPEATAAALAGRILVGSAVEVDENLVRDCVGEIANVVAGQAKALLAGGPHPLAFSMPPVVATAKELRPQSSQDCLAIAFGCDAGEFAMELFLNM
jgi:chemotaxis protein CheX